jgi:hypothetical protein
LFIDDRQIAACVGASMISVKEAKIIEKIIS